MIELDTRYSPGTEEISLSKEFLQALPLPIAESLRQLEQETDPQVRLQHLCFSGSARAVRLSTTGGLPVKRIKYIPVMT